MLSLENDYPPTYQLALDMLKVNYCSNTAAFPILILSKIHTCSTIKKSNKQNFCCISLYTHEAIILVLQTSGKRTSI